MRYPNRWTIGEWTFYEVEGHSFKGELEGRALFGFTIGATAFDGPKLGELYLTLEHAMAAAIAEKYTGARSAGGSGVGTAADWFMKMIGAGQLRDAGADGARVLMQAVREHRDDALAARNIESTLQGQGYVIARAAID